MKKSSKKEVEKFLLYVTKLETIEAIGIARLLGIELMALQKDNLDSEAAVEEGDTGEAAIQSPAPVRNQQNNEWKFKEFDILLSEMLDSFIAAPQQKRKWILQMMKDATYGGK